MENPPPPRLEDKRALRRLIQFIKEVRAVAPDMPAQTIETLLTIAVYPNLSMNELIKKTGLSQSSCSRNVAYLSPLHRAGKQGIDLVKAYEDPEDRRRKLVMLSEKGQQLTLTLARKIQQQ